MLTFKVTVGYAYLPTGTPGYLPPVHVCIPRYAFLPRVRFVLNLLPVLKVLDLWIPCIKMRIRAFCTAATTLAVAFSALTFATQTLSFTVPVLSRILRFPRGWHTRRSHGVLVSAAVNGDHHRPTKTVEIDPSVIRSRSGALIHGALISRRSTLSTLAVLPSTFEWMTQVLPNTYANLS